MQKLTTVAAALAGAALLAGPAAAQIPHITPFAFEGRAGAGVPMGDFSHLAGPGLAVSGSITYHAVPLLGVYAGASHAQFSRDAGAGDYKDTGFDVGARLGIPTPLIPIDPWIKAGVVIHRLELTGAGGADFSDWGTGYEVGAGLGLGFGPISITPGVSYVNHSYNDGAAVDRKASYVKADVGVRIRI
ncbi:MAG TPA: hypothetical protein VGO40_07760 [Longimicrobium sp.]|jgi:hypothetical protein|nr:hypothetical protein [Longimicrobium sp.]